MSGIPNRSPDWREIDTVLLDLDGTLLDQAYDNHIWRDLVPQRFAIRHGLDLHAAYAEIARRFAARSGSLDWYCIEYWSRDLDVDIGALHREVRSHVPGYQARGNFCCAAGRRQTAVLLTSSHPIALAVSTRRRACSTISMRRPRMTRRRKAVLASSGEMR
jgi:putative hydrolase of the HAD superfamily